MKRTRSLRKLTVCALFAAIIALLSPWAIPIGPIPISLGLLGVLTAAITLPPLLSFSSVAVFVALGICGLPVFSGGMSGATVLAGPTGGYLWAYLLAAPLVSLLSQALRRARATSHTWKTLLQTAVCLLGTLVCYICGTLQFVLLTGTRPLAALSVCVLPFLPFDLAKSILAAFLGQKLCGLLRPRLVN